MGPLLFRASRLSQIKIISIPPLLLTCNKYIPLNPSSHKFWGKQALKRSAYKTSHTGFHCTYTSLALGEERVWGYVKVNSYKLSDFTTAHNQWMQIKFFFRKSVLRSNNLEMSINKILRKILISAFRRTSVMLYSTFWNC